MPGRWLVVRACRFADSKWIPRAAPRDDKRMGDGRGGTGKWRWGWFCMSVILSLRRIQCTVAWSCECERAGGERVCRRWVRSCRLWRGRQGRAGWFAGLSILVPTVLRGNAELHARP